MHVRYENNKVIADKIFAVQLTIVRDILSSYSSNQILYIDY